MPGRHRPGGLIPLFYGKTAVCIASVRRRYHVGILSVDLGFWAGLMERAVWGVKVLGLLGFCATEGRARPGGRLVRLG